MLHNRPASNAPLSQLPDKALRWGLTALAALILALIGYFFIRLYIEAKPAFDKFGVIGFTFDNNWDVSKNIYGALPLVVGTLITATIALCHRDAEQREDVALERPTREQDARRHEAAPRCTARTVSVYPSGPHGTASSRRYTRRWASCAG